MGRLRYLCEKWAPWKDMGTKCMNKVIKGKLILRYLLKNMIYNNTRQLYSEALIKQD